jgi:hypothetical protein
MAPKSFFSAARLRPRDLLRRLRDQLRVTLATSVLSVPVSILDAHRADIGKSSLPQEGGAFAVQEAGIGTLWEHHERAVVDVCLRH